MDLQDIALLVDSYISLLVDSYISLRDFRREEEKKIERVKEQEAKTKALIITALKEANSGAVAGKAYTATLKKKISPQVAAWEELYPYIIENDAWDLIQRRISGPAVRERWDDGKEVPGVVAVEVEDLSFTKL